MASATLAGTDGRGLGASVAVALARVADASAGVRPVEGDALAVAGRHPVSPSETTAAVTVPATTNETANAVHDLSVAMALTDVERQNDWSQQRLSNDSPRQKDRIDRCGQTPASPAPPVADRLNVGGAR